MIRDEAQFLDETSLDDIELLQAHLYLSENKRLVKQIIKSHTVSQAGTLEVLSEAKAS